MWGPLARLHVRGFEVYLGKISEPLDVDSFKDRKWMVKYCQMEIIFFNHPFCCLMIISIAMDMIFLFFNHLDRF